MSNEVTHKRTRAEARTVLNGAALILEGALNGKLIGKHVLLPKRNGREWLMDQHDGPYLVVDADEIGNVALVPCDLHAKKKPLCRLADESTHGTQTRRMPSSIVGIAHVYWLNFTDSASGAAIDFAARALLAYQQLEKDVVEEMRASDYLVAMSSALDEYGSMTAETRNLQTLSFEDVESKVNEVSKHIKTVRERLDQAKRFIGAYKDASSYRKYVSDLNSLGVKLSRKTLSRHITAIQNGTAVGRRGKPTILTKVLARATLEHWRTEEPDAGIGVIRKLAVLSLSAEEQEKVCVALCICI
jgi:hypothetical protein